MKENEKKKRKEREKINGKRSNRERTSLEKERK